VYVKYIFFPIFRYKIQDFMKKMKHEGITEQEKHST